MSCQLILFKHPLRLLQIFFSITPNFNDKDCEHPVPTTLSINILVKFPFKPLSPKNDQKTSKQNRSRSEWMEPHFEDLFFRLPELEKEITIKTR